MCLRNFAPSSIVDETINLSFIMSESKTYIFGENQNGGSNGMLGLLAPLLIACGKGACLPGTAGGIVLGIEIQDNFLSLKI